MRVAIIGLACLFPGAPNLGTFWRNIEAGVDAITDVPDGRWDKQFYDPHAADIDRFYCKRGGFVDDHADFDPLAFGVVPKSAASIEPDQLLTLKIGYDAIRDAGYAEKPFPRARTGVVLGRGNYIGAGVLHLEQHVRLLPQILQTLRDLFPDLPQAALDAAKARLQEQFAYYGPDVAAGMIPNLLASRLANRLDLHGPAYTVDAACASSLIAVEHACQALAHGGMDMMLAGGVHLTHDLTFWATFCQLGALSRAGLSRPFSREADGILAGEGVGMAVLKRLDDALADGDRIYAVIEGAGSSSDGRSGSLVAPAASGQLQALEKAWAQAGLAREDIGLLEAHGTGTPAGDAVELETLRAFFGGFAGGDARPVVGSVKSMIGHAMPASGMASLIKTALAIHRGVLPPTLHCEDPNPRLQETRFRVIGCAEPWEAPVDARIAAVNAFGFGGINAHVVLRGVPAAATAPQASPLPPVLLLGAESPAVLLALLDAGAPYPQPGRGPCRLAVIAPDAAKIAMARRAVASGKPWHGRQGIWFSPRGMVAGGGRLAFIFPGVGSSFAPQAADMARFFGAPLPPDCETLDPATDLKRVVVGLLGFNAYLFERLRSLGINPDCVAGHSIGEWSAMHCAGMTDPRTAELIASGPGLDSVAFPDVLFLSAACSEATMRDHLRGIENAALSHDNCPHQVIACGERDAIEVLAERLRQARVLHQILPIVSGFHSPLFAGHMQLYEKLFGMAGFSEPGVPVWSATIAAEFPASAEAKRRLALDHLLKPVRFRAMIDAMYDAGTRVFVEVGTGAVTGFIADTLAGRPHLAVAANREDRGGLAQLQQVCAALWVEGADLDTRLLYDGPKTPAAARSPSTMRLALGVPLVRVPRPLEASLLPGWLSQGAGFVRPAANANDPVQKLLYDTLADIERAGRDVLAVWDAHRQQPAARAPEPNRRISLRIAKHLDIDSTIPFVRDHELYPQRPGWPIAADRRPVVPLTMEVLLVRDAFEAAVPGLKIIEVRDIQAYKWLDVSTPVTIDIVLESRDDGTVAAEIAGYFRALLVAAADYPPSDAQPMPPLIDPRPTEANPVSLYADRWMFHGPAYRGVAAMHAIGDNGIDGALRVPTGQGALLDNMGQLAGYWVMEQPENCLAMPIGVGCITFHAPDPAPGDMLQSQVRITKLDELNCLSDHQLRDDLGRLCITMQGWHTRRYQMDRRLATLTRKPAHNIVCREIADGVMVFEDSYDTAMVRDYISRTYLTQGERAIYDALPPRRRRQWLSGRVAAKDAVLAWLRRDPECGEVYPQELTIANDTTGMPVVLPHLSNNVPDGLYLSISHKNHLAVAAVATTQVGIDIEHIEPRTAEFASIAFTAAERALLGAEDEATFLTRLWVAKEAAAKQAGTGLQGRPRDFAIDARDGDALRVNGIWVATLLMQDCVLGWTLPVRQQTRLRA